MLIWMKSKVDNETNAINIDGKQESRYWIEEDQSYGPDIIVILARRTWSLDQYISRFLITTENHGYEAKMMATRKT